MKLAALFLALSTFALSGMHRAGIVPANAQRNCVALNITNSALIKSLADRKQQLARRDVRQKQVASCLTIHQKAGVIHKFDVTSNYYSPEFREKINSLRMQKNYSCDPCGPDSILDDMQYVEIRPTSHADESTKWQDYC